MCDKYKSDKYEWQIWQIWVITMTNIIMTNIKMTNMINMSDKYDKYEVCSSLAEKRGGSWLPEVTAAISLISQLQKLQKVQKGKQDREKSVIERIYTPTQRERIYSHTAERIREENQTRDSQKIFWNYWLELLWQDVVNIHTETIVAHPPSHPIVQEISTIVVEPTNTGRAQFLLLPKLKREIGSIKWGGR